MHADRAAFIGAILLCESEEGMATEKKYSHRWNKWEKLHRAALDLFAAYDRGVNKSEIYGKAARVIDIINREMLKDMPSGERDDVGTVPAHTKTPQSNPCPSTPMPKDAP